MAAAACSAQRVSVQLDLDVHAGGQIELHQSIDRLVRRVDDVHQSLMGPDLVLVPRVLVDVRGDQDRKALVLGRQRDRPLHRGAGPLGGLDDLTGGLIDQPMIERFQSDTDSLVRHGDYSMIFATTPAPTVRPPSRIAKRRPSSMAIGAISDTVSFTLSPGITISTPSGSSHEPVTSVVRK